MWEKWKKKVSNFFYEDVINEEDNQITSEPIEKRVANAVNQNRTLNTKMTYRYPKERTTPFRFPVIPDDQTENEKLDYNVKRKSRRSYAENSLPIYGYKSKKTFDELAETPAYMRRKRRGQRDNNIQQEEKEKGKRNVLRHTKPDELDRVFKKRDGKLPNIRTEEMIDLDCGKDEKKEKDTINIEDVKIVQHEPLGKKNEATPVKEEIKPTDDVEVYEGNELNEMNQINELNQNEVIEKENSEKAPPILEKTIVEVPNHLLNDPLVPNEDDAIWINEQRLLLDQTLTHFNIDAKIVNVTQGPTVTRFEIQPALGVKVSKIRNLADDIKLNMAAKDIRMEAPIPGKNTIGIEVPNHFPQMVSLQEIIETEEFQQATSPLTIALGLTIEGNPLITDIGKMPHGLIAGATGSGKSVCINTILLSLLYKANHHEVKFLLIDPKMVELTPYNGIPHLISPVITDVKAATMALKWAVDEMEARYEKFVEAGVRNITKYNEKMTEQNKSNEKLPYIVIVIDELADLMMVSPQEVEDAICRIAQKARACGMHLLLATQRPSVDVITGLIKANIPTRIAFSVSSQVDSRTMIDTGGAEKLLGKGDMLFVENGANKSLRLQGPFVSDEEIDRVANYMRSIAEPNYLFEQEQLLLNVQEEEQDELLNEVITFVLEQNQASTSLLQRRFRIGYNRAARLIDTLENKGIISTQNGSKPREVLITRAQIEER